MININKILLIVGGGIVGGFTGYLIGDLIAYKFQENQYLYDEEEESEKDELALEGYKNIAADYSSVSKPNLKDLAEKSMIRDTGNKKLNPWKLISDEEYQNDISHSKEVITYYETDDIFSDVSDNKLENPRELFGPDVAMHFGQYSNDPDVVYIRNENTTIDYEIIRINGSYQLLVMGLSEEEINKPKSPKRPKKKRAENENNSEPEE